MCFCSIPSSIHELTRSRTYFEQAIRGYRTHDCYKAELAWALYGLSETQKANGDDARAATSLEEATSILKQRCGIGTLEDPLTAEDFEKQVSLPAR